MDDVNVENGERKRLFDLAAKKHIALAKAAGNGQGCDRHMFGECFLRYLRIGSD
jgi:carnitine O-acetyltransferase